MTIRRRNHGKSHSYIDTDTGNKVPGVTTIRDNGVPKKALYNWNATVTAEYAVDHWDELADLAPSVRLKTLIKARYAVVDEASNRGTQVHKLAERLVHGDTVTVPEGLEGHVAAYVRFLDEFDVQPILVEKTVWSRQHGYCGTFDLIADLIDPGDPDGGRKTWLLDIKTSRSGIFGETALQLAAYRYADCWIDEDDDGAEMELPEVDATGAVHVRADGYDLIPVDAGEDEFRYFLYAQQIAEFCATSRELVGEPIEAPTTSTWRLTREEWS